MKKQIIYKATPEHKEMLRRKAHKREMSMTDYLRWLVENDDVILTPKIK